MMLQRDPEDEVRRAFKLFDQDNTGRISLKNLDQVAKDLGENISSQELSAPTLPTPASQPSYAGAGLTLSLPFGLSQASDD